MTNDAKEAVQTSWTNGDIPVIVATIAFGMGKTSRRPMQQCSACSPPALLSLIPN